MGKKYVENEEGEKTRAFSMCVKNVDTDDTFKHIHAVYYRDKTLCSSLAAAFNGATEINAPRTPNSGGRPQKRASTTLVVKRMATKEENGNKQTCTLTAKKGPSGRVAGLRPTTKQRRATRLAQKRYPCIRPGPRSIVPVQRFEGIVSRGVQNPPLCAAYIHKM